jgi:hypothetical protein
MKTIKQPSVVPIYGVGAAWVIYTLVHGLSSGADFVGIGVISVILFLALRAIFPTKTIQVKEPEAPKSPEIQSLLDEKNRAISEMRRLNDNIKDETISRQIDHLEATAGKIFDYVAEHPDKQPQIRRFMNYYLPTTIKLLNSYDRMSAVGISGDNIDTTKQKVAEMLGQIETAFDKQLDALFSAEALDISTDITVLENMMAQEGIGGNQI